MSVTEKYEGCPHCNKLFDEQWSYDSQHCNRCGYDGLKIKPMGMPPEWEKTFSKQKDEIIRDLQARVEALEAENKTLRDLINGKQVPLDEARKADVELEEGWCSFCVGEGRIADPTTTSGESICPDCLGTGVRQEG